MNSSLLSFRRNARTRFVSPYSSRLRFQQLENREVPALLVGLTADDTLVTFDSATPATTQSTVAVTGLATGDTLVGIDYRSSNGQLYGISTANKLYTINPTSGAATAVGTMAFTPALSGSSFAVDFNPTVDKLRVISDTNQSLRIDPATGQVVATDTGLTFDAATYANFFDGTPPAPQIVAAAYTSNVDPTGATPVTTLYGIDSNLDALVTIGGAEGTPSPNAGQVFVVSPLDFDATSQTAFDIEPATDMAFVASGTDVFSLNLTTGRVRSWARRRARRTSSTWRWPRRPRGPARLACRRPRSPLPTTARPWPSP